MAATGRGPTDPQRRERIVAAVAQLIVEVGVRGVTHRRIATRAGVPLAATTYYFASLDEMLEEAFATVVAADVVDVRAEIGAIPASTDLPAALAAIVRRRIADRSGTVLASELVVFALRSDRGARLTEEWIEAWTMALEGHLDPESARVAVLLSSSLIQSNAGSPGRLPAAEVESMLRRGLQGPSATTPRGASEGMTPPLPPS